MPGQGPVSTESQSLHVDGDQVFEPLTAGGLFMVLFHVFNSALRKT